MIFGPSLLEANLSKHNLLTVFRNYLVFLIFCLILQSCAPTEIKQPLKKENTTVKNDTNDLPDTIDSRPQRQTPKFSPPKENAANVELEEVATGIPKTKSEHTKSADTQNPNEFKMSSRKTKIQSSDKNQSEGRTSDLIRLTQPNINQALKNLDNLSLDIRVSPQGDNAPLKLDVDTTEDLSTAKDMKTADQGVKLLPSPGGGASNNGLGNALNTTGTTYGQTNVQQKIQIPEDNSKDERDEDIVARQIREAAHLETNQALKKKLWLEYERYRSGLGN